MLLREASQSTPAQGLVKHASDLCTKILKNQTWKLSDKEAMKEFTELTKLLDDDRLRDKECLGYLVKLATQNAQRIETQVKAERNKDGRTHVAGKSGGCAKRRIQVCQRAHWVTEFAFD